MSPRKPLSLRVSTRKLLKETRSLCPRCLAEIPAQVFEDSGRVYLDKRCPAHGPFEVLISSDRRYYYDSVGAGAGGDCCGGGSCGPTGATPDPASTVGSLAEHAATCIALLEIVESCNLRCPTCYADSPYADPADVKALSIEEVESRLARVIAKKGPIDILQLSGGEPTIHPAFLELLGRLLADRRIGYILLNTNGVRLAAEPAFAAELGALRAKHGRLEIYLQFDGPAEPGQKALRGGDLRRMRERAIDAAASANVPVTLAMTVTGDNLHTVGDSVRFGLGQRAIRGITFQPMFGSGRSHEGAELVHIRPHAPQTAPRRINVADLMEALLAQSEGLLSPADFTPLPCGDPNCHTVGYVLRRGDVRIPASKLVDFSVLQGFLRDRMSFNMADLERCGCEAEPLGGALKALEIGPDHVFRIFLKPFMDAWTYDQDRIDRCCVHVVKQDGALESFCRHYALQT